MKTILSFIKTSLLITFIIGIIWLGGFMWFAYQANSLHPYDTEEKSDVIVVLTGGDGRLEAGLNLFAAKRGLYLFITSVYNQLNEEDIRNRWNGATPLPICCIILDHEADSTAENAIMTRNWMNDFNASTDGPPLHSVRLVTSNYHMLRALLDFKRILPDILVYPHPIISPNATLWSKNYWVLLVNEYNKYLFRAAQQHLPAAWQEAAS